jgi:signal transduction histidine kinase
VKLGTTSTVRAPTGTRIEISDLKGTWSEKKVEQVFKDLAKLESIFSDLVGRKSSVGKKEKTPNDFEVFIYKDVAEQQYSDKYLEDLRNLIDNRAAFKIEDGRYDEAAREFQFTINGHRQKLSLNDPSIAGNVIFKDRFGKTKYDFNKRTTACGPFDFGFYIFDLSKDAPAQYELDKEDKDIIKEHRIYLYRDGIRVYPYGDPEDDWLQIDAYRGTKSAGQFLSNDQVVGFVNITQLANPDLRDKTNREGLIDTGNPTDHFVWLLQIFLSWLRAKPYAQYRLDLEDKKVINQFKQEQVKDDFAELREVVKSNKAAASLLSKVEKRYDAERKYLVQRAETTEELAGVGLSVETASHDIMSIMHKAQISLDNLIRATSRKRQIDVDKLNQDLAVLRGMLSFVEAQLKDIQLLFKSSKQQRRSIRVKDTLDKVVRLFESVLEEQDISLNIKEIGSPLVAKTTDAVLLQLFLNLFDNAVYWTPTGKSKLSWTGRRGS